MNLSSFLKASLITANILLSVGLIHCSESEESKVSPESTIEMKSSMASSADEAYPEEISNNIQKTERKKELSNSNEKYTVKFSAVDTKWARLLEYNVSLEFESNNFGKTRDDLYKMAGVFGFLQQSTDSFHSNKSLNASVWIRSEKLYEFLEMSNSLGKLRSESIEANDLTFDNFVQNVSSTRESIRGQRRSRSLSGSSDAKNYTEKERLLAESEDKEDSAKKEKWLINDRVTWAKVQITIIDPNQEKSIQIPDFTEVFYDLVSGFLYLVYLTLYMIPFILIGYFIWLKKSWFHNLFSKN